MYCHLFFFLAKKSYLIKHLLANLQRIMDYDEEDLDDYSEGGYHPVKPNDQLKEVQQGDFQYTIQQKLGFGSYSTVWLARDERFVQFLMPLL